MSIREVVLTRDELVRYLSKRLKDKVDIGRMTAHIENAFVFQNDVGRPAYLLEVDEYITTEQINYLSDCLEKMNVCACLIPGEIVKYGASVTPESMGIENIKTAQFGWQAQEWEDFPTVEDIEGESE